MTAKPWAIYTRVSTSDQAEQGVSLDAQLISCRSYATSKGWAIADEISDPGESAGSLKRPGIQQVLAGLRSGKYAGVIVWRLDRLTRSIRDLLTLLDLANDHGVGLVSVTESLDTTSPMGRFVVHLLGAIAQWERETIGTRVKSAMAHAKGQGYWMGSAIPAGCRLVADGQRKRLARGDQAAQVAKAWTDVLAGASLRDVAERFIADGVDVTQKAGCKSRRGWTPETIRNLLLSPQVIGVLIDGATHAAVRRELESRMSPKRRGAARAAGSQAAAPSPVAGIVRCPSCDGACVQVTASGNGGAYRYFRCAARVKGLCRQKDLRCERIEDKVMAAIVEALQPGSGYHAELREDLKRARSQLDSARTERIRLMGERDQVSARVSQLTLRTQIGTEIWDEAMKALGGELKRIDRRLSELQGVIAAGEVDSGDLDLVLRQMAERATSLATADLEEQRIVIRTVAAAARVDDDGVVLDLFRPKPRQADGSYNAQTRRTHLHGERTIRVRVRI